MTGSARTMRASETTAPAEASEAAVATSNVRRLREAKASVTGRVKAQSLS
jgi:hypothetical protein